MTTGTSDTAFVIMYEIENSLLFIITTALCLAVIPANIIATHAHGVNLLGIYTGGYLQLSKGFCNRKGGAVYSSCMRRVSATSVPCNFYSVYLQPHRTLERCANVHGVLICLHGSIPYLEVF